MEENPRIQAKWDGGCSRDSLTPGKSAASGKGRNMERLLMDQEILEKAANIMLEKLGYGRALQETQGVGAMTSRAVHLPEEPGSASLVLSQE